MFLLDYRSRSKKQTLDVESTFQNETRSTENQHLLKEKRQSTMYIQTKANELSIITPM